MSTGGPHPSGINKTKANNERHREKMKACEFNNCVFMCGKREMGKVGEKVSSGKSGS